ncbi:MAG: CoF synthetase [Gemmatimonadaceae bacterium]|nr:CoF synthetase [Gemmatimonadaceae bacterium]
MRTTFAALAYIVTSPIVTLLHRVGLCGSLFALPGFERLRWKLGELGAWLRFQEAWRTVPAYRAFIARRVGSTAGGLLAIEHVPVTDKASYVNAWPLEARCVRGALPASGVVIDESSGTGGAPTSWVRGARERDANARAIRRGLQHRLGRRPIFVINAFALGPWATGINLTLSLSRWCRVKSLGPDIAKIGNTLRDFGQGHHFVIMGYPPFLKQLVDTLEIDWVQYRVSMIYGGEGMSESMRRYLMNRGIERVYGSYGASDLDLNIAAETELTIALRRLLADRPELAARLVHHRGSMPMIFQFNPADFFIETNADGELLVTVCRPDYVAPKVRYNIHDLGHVVRFPELAKVLAEVGIPVASLDRSALDLPLLFLYGRADAAVSYYGCKIPPADVQEALYRVHAIAGEVDGFQLATFDDAEGDKRLVLHLEVTEALAGADAGPWTGPVFDALAAVNQDFRESRRMVPAGKQPSLVLHARGEGPFAGMDPRVKRRYIAPAVGAPEPELTAAS